MMPSQRVHEFMSTDVVVVRPEASVLEAVALLLEERVTGLPVVNEAGALVGILTEQDCLRVAFQDGYYQGPGRTVAQAMTPDPHTLDADADMMTAIELFLKRPFRRFPVMKNGALVGVLSRRDALRMIKEQA